ncbi:MAG: sugar ABC transporter permease [Chloroflexota bacterium]|nr:sugar ABC transporter permease [Chloroflexota bacterium]
MAIADLGTTTDVKTGRGGWLRQTVANQPIGRLLLLPALAYAILVTQAPFLYTLWLSFERWNLNRPNLRGFTGLGNYELLLFRDPAFWQSILNTFIIVVAAVVLSMAFGLFYAELVNHKFLGRGVVRTMLITPFLIMPVAAALHWKNQMLNPIYGVVNWVLSFVPGSFSPNWLGTFPEQSIIAVLVWRWAPFMMLILLAGMQSISEETREAVRVDGATAWREFRDITLPHLYRFFQLGGLLATVFIVQEIDPIYMMTKGGPGNATTTLPYLVYRKAIEGSNVGLGAATGVITVLLSIVAITLLLRALDRMLRED